MNRRATTSSFHVFADVPTGGLRRDFIRSCALEAAKLIRRPIGQIDFVLVGDREMAKLHRKYAGVSGTTDVLTFDLSESGKVEADIYICLDQARRQASEYGIPVSHEVARLAVHGVLHLAGHDDRTESGRARMRKLEDQALASAKESV